ncbi:MAG: hypothetical protein HQM16_05985, partial [Deltaproteobacteria bacterium]|nr:hypothetical protein [Deltaproteobacteria bacterium]
MKRFLITINLFALLFLFSSSAFAGPSKPFSSMLPWGSWTKKPVIVPFKKPCNYKQYLHDRLIWYRPRLRPVEYKYNDCDEDGFDSIRDGGADCRDYDKNVNPDATEIPYDGKDNDCVDGDLVDVDGDGFDSVLAGGTDCDDDNPDINPDAADTTCDNIDNDCSGVVDDAVADLPALNTQGLCAGNVLVCMGGEFVVAESNYVPAPEVCDGLDNDCAGGVDDGLISRLAANQQGACSGNIETCEGALGWRESSGNYVPAAEVCDGVDNDCANGVDDGVAPIATDNTKGLCADNVKVCAGGEFVAAESNYVPVDETCDNQDNNCDGDIDNGIEAIAADNTNGLCSGNVKVCIGGDYIDADTNYSPVDEICDTLDNNCNGEYDEGVTITAYVDGDGDGYGADDALSEQVCFLTGYSENNTDCNDDAFEVNPGAEDTTLIGDENCDGQGIGNLCEADAFFDGIQYD